MPLKPLHITERRYGQIERLSNLNERQLSGLLDAVSASKDTYLSVHDLRQKVEPHVSSELSDDLIQVLTSLRVFADEKAASVEEVVAALIEGIDRYKSASPDVIAWLKHNQKVFVDILSAPVVYGAGKLADLYHEHLNHLHDARIITNLVPAFDETRTEIGAFVVQSNLRLIYSDRFENEHYLQIALTRSEISELRLECERALRKLESVENFIDRKTQRNVVVFGELRGSKAGEGK